MSEKPLYFGDVANIRDKDTGEWSKQSVMKCITRKSYGRPFVLVFLEHTQDLYNLTKAAGGVLWELVSRLPVNSNVVSLTAKARMNICTKLKIATSNFSRALAELEANKLIYKDKGEIQINPIVIWRGDAQCNIEMCNNVEIQTKFIIHPENYGYDVDSVITTPTQSIDDINDNYDNFID